MIIYNGALEDPRDAPVLPRPQTTEAVTETEIMTTSISDLGSYLPDTAVKRLGRHRDAAIKATAHKSLAALLFADIVGFTPLTEQMARRGREGAEELSNMLNDFLGRMISLINAHGGDVVKFSGDALLVIWEAETESLQEATQRALQCALAMQAAMNDNRQSVHFSLKVAVVAGEIAGQFVGTDELGWRFLLAGEAVTQVALAEKRAVLQGVTLSPQAWELVREHCIGNAMPDGHFRAVSVEEVIQPHPLSRKPIPEELRPFAQSLIPDMVFSRLEAGQGAWTSEIRRITVLFIAIRGIDLRTSDTLSSTQPLAEAFETIMRRYDGCAKEIGADDKGLVMIAMFGLPPHSHEDDAARAIDAAVDFQEKVRDLGFHASIGITSGRVFCGPVGNQIRRDFTMYGDEVNLAARLMLAAAEDTVLCDESTCATVQPHRFQFDRLPEFTVKGKSSPVAVYRAARRTYESAEPLVGRATEVAALRAHLESVKKGLGGLLLIEGEPGIGKSRLVAELVANARDSGLRCFVGAANPMESTTPYHAWRSVFAQLIGLPKEPDMETQTLRTLRCLSDYGIEPAYAPLLNVVLPFDLPASEFTMQLSNEAHADNTRDLLATLLQRAVASSPIVVVIEDGHWLDSPSWLLLQRLSRQPDAMLLAIATRPLPHQTAEYVESLGDDRLTRLSLDMLSPDDVLALARQRLGLYELEPSLQQVVGSRAEGNPLFIEELIYALRDKGLLVVDEGVCRLVPDRTDVRSLDLPSTLEGLITSRIDLLGMQEQLVLKVASAIGRTFSLKLVADIFPTQANVESIRDATQLTSRLQLTRIDASDPDLYSFKHSVIQETAYDLMLESQRRHLHRLIAEWYETNHADELSSFYPLLASHWIRADDKAKSINYLEKAGEQAVRNFANDEAVSFLTQALDMAAQTAVPVDDERIGLWQLQLGDVYANLADRANARASMEAGLSRLAMAVPRNMPRLVVSILGEVLRQVLHRRWPRRYVGSRPSQRTTLLAAARAYQRLAEVYYYFGDVPRSFYSAFRFLNCAELAGPSPELAGGYVYVGALIGFIPLHDLAKNYVERALAVARGENNLPALENVSVAAGFYYSGIGEWSKAEQHFTQTIDVAERLGDVRRLNDSLDNMVSLKLFQGDCTTALKLADRLHSSATQRNNLNDLAIALHGKASSFLRLGSAADAITYLTQLHDLLVKQSAVIDEPGTISLYGLLALAHLREGRQNQALEFADQAMHLTASTRPSSWDSLAGYVGPAEVYVALWDAAYPVPRVERLAAKACGALRAYTKVFPIGLPRYWVLQGMVEWLKGRSARAFKAWDKGLREAQRLGMPFEEGLAAYQIGRHLAAADVARRSHLERARAVFARLGTSYHQALVEKEL